MDILWAPWREKYVERIGLPKKKCVFCHIGRQKQDAKTYVFLRSAHAYAVLNLYPFSGGHTLVIPNRHVGDLSELKMEERQDTVELLLRTQKLMSAVLKPDGFNVGINLGKASGAGIPEHLHIHIVPRWIGDINFMPALFGTKVIPVSLDKTYKRLKNAAKAGHREV